jgi:hypothetical protein
MNLLSNTDQIGGIPLTWDDIRFLQDSLRDGIAAIPNMLGDHTAAEKAYIVTGMGLVSESGGTQTRVLSGWLYLAGELYFHDETVYNITFGPVPNGSPGGAWFPLITQDPAGDKIKQNTDIVQLYQVRKVTVVTQIIGDPGVPPQIFDTKTVPELLRDLLPDITTNANDITTNANDIATINSDFVNVPWAASGLFSWVGSAISIQQPTFNYKYKIIGKTIMVSISMELDPGASTTGVIISLPTVVPAISGNIDFGFIHCGMQSQNDNSYQPLKASIYSVDINKIIIEPLEGTVFSNVIGLHDVVLQGFLRLN